MCVCKAEFLPMTTRRLQVESARKRRTAVHLLRCQALCDKRDGERRELLLRWVALALGARARRCTGPLNPRHPPAATLVGPGQRRAYALTQCPLLSQASRCPRATTAASSTSRSTVPSTLVRARSRLTANAPPTQTSPLGSTKIDRGGWDVFRVSLSQDVRS